MLRETVCGAEALAVNSAHSLRPLVASGLHWPVQRPLASALLAHSRLSAANYSLQTAH